MSKQLQKFSNVLEKLFAPLAAKLAGNLYLQVIATSFMTILPLILIGSFALILSQPIVDYHLLSKTDVFYPVMKGWAQAAEVYGSHLNFLFGVTLGSQGVYLSLAIAYNLAQKRLMNVFLTMLVALVSFLVVNSQYVEWNWDTAYFGGTGLFSAIITTFAAVDTVFGVSLASVVSQLGWWFGIHSSAILSVVMPSFDANTLENAAAYAAGTPLTELPRIVTSSFYFNFVAIGGGGATLGLVLLMLRSKSIQIRTVGKLAIIPGIFGINEPVLFGLPIVLNPIFLIPFLLTQVVNIFLCYGAMAVGLVNRTLINVSSTVPVGVGQWLSSLDYRAVILTVVCIAANMLVYYPFYKLFEKEKLAEEQLPSEQNPEDAIEVY